MSGSIVLVGMLNLGSVLSVTISVFFAYLRAYGNSAGAGRVPAANALVTRTGVIGLSTDGWGGGSGLGTMSAIAVAISEFLRFRSLRAGTFLGISLDVDSGSALSPAAGGESSGIAGATLINSRTHRQYVILKYSVTGSYIP